MDREDWGEPLRPKGLDSTGDGCFVVACVFFVVAMMALLVLAGFER